MTKHPWHEASTGLNPPEYLNGIVEISTGMRTKYEVDKETGLLKLDRRVIGVMRMIDQGLADDKILAVPENDANASHLKDIDELAPHFKLELKEFFESYKRLENKVVTVPDFQGKETALTIILRSIEYYKKVFKK